jgi:hypothetical protein
MDMPAKSHRAPRTRRVSAWVLVVLASLLIPVSVISVWAINTLTDTDKYVSTMAPLATNQVIVDRLAQKSTDELFSSHVVENKVTAALPTKAKPLVQPLVTQLHSYVYNNLALKVFESPKFSQLWNGLNRRSHQAVIDVLTGKQSPLTKKLEVGGAIVLNVSPAIDNVIKKADAHGIPYFNPLKSILGSGKSLTVTILSKNQVSEFSGLFNLVVKLKWAIPIIALVLGILAVVLALERRKTLLRWAIGVALMTVLLLGVLALGRNIFLNKAADKGASGQQVAAAVWDIVLRYLMTDLRWTLLIAVLIALGCWLAGPARYAVTMRRGVARAWHWLGAQVKALQSGTSQHAAESGRVRRTGAWIGEHANGLRILGVVVAALFLIFGGNLTGWSLLVILLVLVVYLALVQMVVVWARNVRGPAVEQGADTSIAEDGHRDDVTVSTH